MHAEWATTLHSRESHAKKNCQKLSEKLFSEIRLTVFKRRGRLLSTYPCDVPLHEPSDVSSGATDTTPSIENLKAQDQDEGMRKSFSPKN